MADVRSKEGGFILVSTLFFMVLMALVAFSMNRKTGLQTRLVSNRVQAAQVTQGNKAAIEYAKWKLSKNPAWRTNPAGENFDFAGLPYLLKVVEVVKPVYGNVIELTCGAPGVMKIYKAYFTPANTKYIYITDSKNSCIRRVKFTTSIMTRFITTFAGIGESSGFYGDGGPATSARLNEPKGVSANTDNKVYIADTKNNRVRMVDIQTGIITTVAGNGNLGYSGDGGPAAAASLNEPGAVSTAPSGNIYIADTSNNRIRKVDAATGIIITAAGTGSSGYSGDGGPATNAKLAAPSGVFVDKDGNIYIADTSNSRIRRVDASTGIITTVAGNGAKSYSGDGAPAVSAALNTPMAVMKSPAGHLYIADTGNYCIRKVNGGTGIIRTFAGIPTIPGYSNNNIPATSAKLEGVSGVTVDLDETVFINEKDNHRIRVVDPGTGLISTLAGTGISGYWGDNLPAFLARMDEPSSVSAGIEANFQILSRLKDLY